jgi:Ca2+-binding EF-hand superfamily protein
MYTNVVYSIIITSQSNSLFQVLKEILREIDSTLTEDDLDNIIEEVDEDGSGTLDFDEFQEMMMG